MISFDLFRERLAHVQAEIVQACAAARRNPSEVTLLAVTKTHPAAALEFAARAGLVSIGENRVQEAAEKKPTVVAKLKWELIGHLQSNKARLAVDLFDRIQSVDSAKLINHLGRAATEANRFLPILLQINAGNDPAKYGADPAAAELLLSTALSQASLRVEGLMTIAPLGETPDATHNLARQTFENLRQLRDKLATASGIPLAELSMGMSGDLQWAIASGSTLVRVGTALFGDREATA